MSEPARLDGKIALVTGGARGIGEGIARGFVRHGAQVLVCDINVEQGEATARACMDDITRLFQARIPERFGPKRGASPRRG